MLFNRYLVLSDENEDFIREYELDASLTLRGLHDFICDDLGYDPAEITSFFTSGQDWEKNEEIPLVDMGMSGRTMEQVILSNLQAESSRLIYQFDPYGGRTFYIKGSGPHETTGTLPRVGRRAEEPPAQFLEDEDEGFDIFAEALGDFGSFEGDDLYEDDF